MQERPCEAVGFCCLGAGESKHVCASAGWKSAAPGTYAGLLGQGAAQQIFLGGTITVGTHCDTWVGGPSNVSAIKALNWHTRQGVCTHFKRHP